MKRIIITACLCLSVSYCFANDGNQRDFFVPETQPSQIRGGRESPDLRGSPELNTQESDQGSQPFTQDFSGHQSPIERQDSEPIPGNQEAFPAYLKRHPSMGSLPESSNEGKENLKPITLRGPELGQSPTPTPPLFPDKKAAD
jgi:hypothetical protein